MPMIRRSTASSKRTPTMEAATTAATQASFPVTKSLNILPGKLGFTYDWEQGPGVLIAVMKKHCILRKHAILIKDRIMTVNGHVITKDNHAELLSSPEASTKDRILGIHQPFYRRTTPISAAGGAIKIGGTFDRSKGPGFIVTKIEPDSPLRGLIDVGDHIITNNGITIMSSKEIISYKKRTLTILKQSVLAELAEAGRSTQLTNIEQYLQQEEQQERIEEDGRQHEILEYERELLEEERKKNDAEKRRLARLAVGGYNMTSEEGRAANALPIYPDNGMKKSFPMMMEFGIPIVNMDESNTEDVQAATTRQNLLSELIMWNEKHGQKHEVYGGSYKHRLLKVSVQTVNYAARRGITMEDKESYLIRYLKRTRIIEELLDCISKHYHCTEAETLDFLLRYMTKIDASTYLKHMDYAQEIYQKQLRKPPKGPPEVPHDYVDYEGNPDDPQWNLSYMQLLKFKEKHGHVKVTCSDPELGRFVVRMRSAYKAKLPSLTPKRIELLEKIGFMWVGRPDIVQPIPGGCPRFNRAMVAKLVYPQLTLRECFHLGGFTDEEMDVCANGKYAWRTVFTTLKDKLNLRLKQWPKLTRVVGTNKGVKDLKEILESNKYNRVERVFGKDKVELLEKYLAAAEERERNPEKPKAKRKRHTNASRSKKSNQGQRREVPETGSTHKETEDKNDYDRQPTSKKLRTEPQPPRQEAAGTNSGDMQAEGCDPVTVAGMVQQQAVALYGGGGGGQVESSIAAMQFQL